MGQGELALPCLNQCLGFWSWTQAVIKQYLPKWVEELQLHKNFQMNDFRSFSHNCPKLKVTKMSFKRWMNKQTVEQPYSGMLSSKKKNWAVKPHEDMEETARIVLSEGSHSETGTYCMISNTWHYRKNKTILTMKISVIKIQDRRWWLDRWDTGDV